MYMHPLTGNLMESNAGAKAFHLGKLKKAGLPVPEGFVVTSNAFEEFVKHDMHVSDAFITELKSSVDQVGAARYMVRSSAIGEDGDYTSFAGQLDSFQSSSNPDEVLANIQKCWASYRKENVRQYEKWKGVKLQGMAVVVQTLIEPDHAGVIFTRNPENESELLVEYVEGHGDQLVSGSVTPHRFSYGFNGSGPHKLPLEFNEAIRIARDLERTYQTPLDIEWAMKDKRFYLLQVRPITTQSKGRKVFWSNTNVNENYPDAVTPLLYSVARDAYYNYFRELSRLFLIHPREIRRLEPSYANVIGIFGCRIYYNMTSIHEIISASPFSAMLIKSFDNFVGYSAGAAQPVDTGSKLGFLLKVIRFQFSLSKTVREFESLANHYKDQADAAISFDELRQCFHAFIEIRMRSWYRASLADFFAMLYHGALGKFCKKYYGADADGIHNKLIQAIPGLVSSKPIVAMHSLKMALRNDKIAYRNFRTMASTEFSRWLKQSDSHVVISKMIDDYISEWGFRCSGELMLTTRTYCEAPEDFIDLLKQYDQMPDVDPGALIASRYAECKKTIAAFKRKIFRRYHLLFPLALAQVGVLHLLIHLATVGIKARERVRLKQALLYFKFKKIVERIGKSFQQRGLIEQSSDILFLRYQEIAENLSSSDMLNANLKERIKLATAEFTRASALRYPDDFSTRYGEYPPPTSLNGHSYSPGGKVLKGLPVCGGQVRGKAKVLSSVAEAGKLEKGDILITRQTDPGWVVVFPLISGLIVERGGMLSHGAIVSREFGIPAIVGVERASERIQDGDELILNADTGEISIL